MQIFKQYLAQGIQNTVKSVNLKLKLKYFLKLQFFLNFFFSVWKIQSYSASFDYTNISKIHIVRKVLSILYDSFLHF